MMSREREPWRCRVLRWHRWEPVITGAELCTRPGCIEIKAARPDPTDRLPGDDYWVVVHGWDGRLKYSGPVPVPDAADYRSPEDVRLRRFNTYEVTLIEFDQEPASG